MSEPQTNPRKMHPMLNRLLHIADAMDEYGFGVGDHNDGPFVREAAYELEHLKRLGEVSNRGFETVCKVADRLQVERDSLLAAAKAAVAVLPGLEVHSWPPGHRMKADALELLRAAIAKTEEPK